MYFYEKDQNLLSYHVYPTIFDGHFDFRVFDRHKIVSVGHKIVSVFVELARGAWFHADFSRR